MVVKEFVERGVSGTSTNRPALQEMLRYLEDETNDIDYVIVHKLDRLARNRADDVEINKQFDQFRVRLISTSENIDQTPGGLLLHGIMSSIAEFCSKNLSNEVKKGMDQKERSGGTPGRVPIGYLNIRTVENGREARTVIVDEQRKEQEAQVKARIDYVDTFKKAHFAALMKISADATKRRVFLNRALEAAEQLPEQDKDATLMYLREMETDLVSSDPLLNPKIILPKVPEPSDSELEPFLQKYRPAKRLW